ncbi:cation diffusion facilitator family transporter [Treponema primitia]|uniref:cation diffusion facilitator family transporter n=1 Tax=Treponema primitia TaxID=88058 RepID=UPI003980B84C
MMAADSIRQKLGRQSGVVILVSNSVLFVFKYIVGVISNSISIQADAVNNLTDTVSAILTIIGFQIAGKPKDQKHPHGYGRMEYISGLAIACLIIAAGILFVKSSIERLINPEPVLVGSLFIVLVTAIAIFAKLALALYSHKLNKIVRSATIKATMMDCLFDAVVTLLTLITLGLSQITALPIDAVIGLAVSGLIIYNGFMSAKENIGLLLGNSLDIKAQQQIEAVVVDYREFNGIRSIIANDFGPNNQIVVVELSPNQDFSISDIQSAADTLSLKFEEQFNFKVILYWNSKNG